MMVLHARGVEKSFGDRHVLRGVDLLVRAGERVALVGPNGCGKSTLLTLLSGDERADAGAIDRQGRFVRLSQEPKLVGDTVAEVAEHAISWHRALVAEYESALAAGDAKRSSAAQDRLEVHGWEIAHRVDAMLDRVGAPPRSALVAKLSGGERRRLALACALLSGPDVLLLDEPTNHLDADTVEWLQGFLQGFRGTVVLVTHDRYLLEAVANRIVELEDGKALVYDDCSYGDWLVLRAERRANEARDRDQMLGLIEREAAWASRSPAARTVKQKARLDRLDALRTKVPPNRRVMFRLDLRSGLKLGSTIVELHGVKKKFGEKVLFRDLNLALVPGERIGLLGPNGAGKTTLLRMILGDVKPDAGDVLRGPRVRVGLVDQARSGLPDDETLFDAVGGGNDHVKIGEDHVHVATFLERFLFKRESFTQKVGNLSGGERARLLIARLLMRGANVLLLDEPTNDLDLDTLRVLEEALCDFDGCVLVVTHDRAFLDRVCTGMLAFEGDGLTVRYADRLQYMAALAAREKAKSERPGAEKASVPASQPGGSQPASNANKKRLSFKEQQELAGLPAKIDALEAEQAALTEAIGDPALWAKRPAEGAAKQKRLGEIPGEIEVLFERWSELDGRG